MPTAKKICRVCGKSYEACRTTTQKTGVFLWREVACSPDCGAVYLQRINEGRGIAQKPKPSGRRSMPIEIEVEPTEVVSEPADVAGVVCLSGFSVEEAGED